MFNTKEEFILALMEGRKFKFNQSELTYDKHTEGNPFKIDGTTLLGTFDKFNLVTEVFSNWYDDPANVGKLCWFWDEVDNNKIKLSKLREYRSYSKYSFESLDNEVYRYARLLTPEELAILGGIEQIKNT